MRSRERRSPRPLAGGAGAKRTDQAGKQVAPFIAPTGDQRNDGLPLCRPAAALAALAREHRSFAILPDDGPPLIVIRVDPADDVEWALDLIVEDNMPMLAFVDGTDGLRMRSKFYRVY